MNQLFFKTLHCKVSLLVVHHIGFHGLEPLSRQKIAPQKKSLYNSTFAGFSYIFVFVMHGGCPKFLPQPAVLSPPKIIAKLSASPQKTFATSWIIILESMWQKKTRPRQGTSRRLLPCHTSFCGSCTYKSMLCLRCWSLHTFIGQFLHFHARRRAPLPPSFLESSDDKSTV